MACVVAAVGHVRHVIVLFVKFKFVYGKIDKDINYKHNIHKLMTQIFLFQYKNQKSEKQNKRPSRKHRRRPKNLLAEYNRRKRKHVWLETHIWHAKRFHMIEKWGCKLPWRPTDKSSRACYRATTKHCLIQVCVVLMHAW